MKKYTKDMTAEEVMRRLKSGEIVRSLESDTVYRISNGLLCRYGGNCECIGIGVRLNPWCDQYYFDCPDEFKITKTGLYRTRDGRKVFVSYIVKDDEDCDFPVEGVIEGSSEVHNWRTSGLWDGYVDKITDNDIVGEWNET